MRKFDGFSRGVNLGGWVSQCGEGSYTKERFDTFITEKDIATIASWGLDHVRMPIDYQLFQQEDGAFIESGFGYIDRCIAWCGKYGLNLVLDLHKTMGFIFDDSDYCQFFAEKPLQDNFVRVWEEFTRRYGQYSDRVVFELLNEVTSLEFATKWNEIALRAIRAIRALNKDVRIIVGGIYNNSIEGLSLLDAPHDENIVFTFHCYSPLLFTHQSAYWVQGMPRGLKVDYPLPENELRAQTRAIFGDIFDREFSDSSDLVSEKYFARLFEQAIAIAEKHNVPLYCGEYGVIDQANPEATVRWFRDINAAFEKYHIARACWTYKDKDFGLVDPHYAPVAEHLVKLL